MLVGGFSMNLEANVTWDIGIIRTARNRCSTSPIASRRTDAEMTTEYCGCQLCMKAIVVSQNES